MSCKRTVSSRIVAARRDEDHFVVRTGVSWAEYEQVLEERGEHSRCHGEETYVTSPTRVKSGRHGHLRFVTERGISGARPSIGRRRRRGREAFS